MSIRPRLSCASLRLQRRKPKAGEAIACDGFLAASGEKPFAARSAGDEEGALQFSAGGRNDRWRMGFSLMEILVVASVVAVLAALLLSSISVVKRQAVLAKCAGQMRQIGLAVISYANENDGAIAPSWVSPELAPATWGYPTIGSPVLWWAPSLLGQFLDGFESPLVEALPPSKYKSVVKCPATRRTDGRNWEGTMALNINYCAFINVAGFWSNIKVMSRVRRQSQAVLLLDGGRPFWTVNGWQGYPNGLNGLWWPWHGGNGANAGFFDGHTAYLPNVSAELIAGNVIAN